MNEAGKPDAVAGRTLLFVHGRDFKPAPDVFMELSMEALRVGMERDYPDFAEEFAALDKRIAYYGDITDDYLSGQGLLFVEMLDIGDRRNALIKLRSFERSKQFGFARFDRLRGKQPPAIRRELLRQRPEFPAARDQIDLAGQRRKGHLHDIDERDEPFRVEQVERQLGCATHLVAICVHVHVVSLAGISFLIKPAQPGCDNYCLKQI